MGGKQRKAKKEGSRVEKMKYKVKTSKRRNTDEGKASLSKKGRGLERETIKMKRKTVKKSRKETIEARQRWNKVGYMRMTETGIMIPSVMHDIRGYISVIKGHAQLGAMETSDEKAKARFEKINSTIKAIEEVIESFRGFYKYGEVVKGDVEISKIIDESISNVSHKLDQVSLVKYIDDFKVQANRILVRQALINLISNAADAVEKSRDKIIGVVAKKIDSKGYIWVFDSGTGIKPEIAKRLFFEPLTTKEHGTGLGLLITRKIIEAHGWRIKLISDPRSILEKIAIRSPDHGAFQKMKTVFEIEISQGA